MMGHNVPVDVIPVTTFAGTLHEKSGRTPSALHKPVHGHVFVINSTFYTCNETLLSATIISSPSFVTRPLADKYFKRDSMPTFNSDVGIYNQGARSQPSSNTASFPSSPSLTSLTHLKNTK
jgi:hypothetical protein